MNNLYAHCHKLGLMDGMTDTVARDFANYCLTMHGDGDATGKTMLMGFYSQSK